MSTQAPNSFGASPVSPQSAQQPARRRTSTMITVTGLVVVVALLAGFFVLRHHGSVDPKSVSQTTAWNSTSNNWSGYAETTAQTGQKFTKVVAEWVVPSVATMKSTNAVGCSALWDGIGGATSKDLIQLGTDSCSNASQTGYFAWYEILPAAGVEIPSLAIQPGDRVLATLQLVSGGTNASTQTETANYAAVMRQIQRFDPNFGSKNVIERLRQLLAEGEAHLASEPWFPKVESELRSLFSSPAPSAAQEWQFSFSVTAPNGAVQTWSKTLQYQSSLSSVEWITEAPTASSGIEPLPNYGIAHFLGASVNGTIPSLTPTNQIVLADPHGEASVPSAPVGQVDEFNTCYFPTFNVTACPVP